MELILEKPIGTVSVSVMDRLDSKGKLIINCGSDGWNGFGYISDEVPAILLNVPKPKHNGKSVDGLTIDEAVWKSIIQKENELKDQITKYVPESVIWKMQDGTLVIEWVDSDGKTVNNSKVEPEIIVRLHNAIMGMKNLAKAMSISIPSVMFQNYQLLKTSYMDLINKYESQGGTDSHKKVSKVIAFSVCFRCGRAKIVGSKSGNRITRMADTDYKAVKETVKECKRQAKASGTGVSWKQLFEEKGYSVYVRDRNHCGC